MKSCHFEPTGIMVRASVHPLMTWSARKLAGSLPCFDEASKTLDYLAAKYGDCFVFQPQGKPLSITDFISAQRRVLAIVMRKESK